ncbi:MAG TPA: type II toxin-antitoxin system HicB family antitoxin [Dongiaceae bacterium]|nr:type II toxin-antitoxin system HicB family antitoxin [Dongiaceae bacterium]
MKFVIVMEQGEDESWSVRVPDLPGCFSWGATRDEAVQNAREAIQGHIEVMREFGDPVPDGVEGKLLAEIIEVA